METITIEEYRALTKPRAKYRNTRISEDGYTFDSLAELERYRELLLLEKAGQIKLLQVHPRYELQPKFVDRDGTRQQAIVYEPDFMYCEVDRSSATEVLIAEDIKGCETQLFNVKRKLFLYKYPHIELRVLKV